VARGTLITIEGLDGAGKSTLAAELARELTARGRQVELLREPGGVQVSERIRDLLKDPALEIGARAEALLYAAARAQLVQERIAPALARAATVLLDRFVDSSLAYQGGGRALGVEAVAALNEFAAGGLRPDRTLLLRIEPALGRSRQATRGAPADRLEQSDERFFDAVAATYEELAAREPERFVVLDARASPDELLAGALAALSDILPARAPQSG
jgi:dTMP kinase